MNMRFLVVVMVLSAFKLYAQKTVDITYEISFVVPERCSISFDSEQKVHVIDGNEYSCKVKFFPFDDGASTLDSDWREKRKLDTLFFKDLHNATLIKKEKNKLFEFGKNHMKKTYYDKGVYNVTYTTYTTEGMYLFRFTTKTESLLPVFNEMLSSIDYYRGNLLRRTQYALSMSPIVLLLILLTSIPCAFLYREGDFLKNLMNGIAIFSVGAGIICWGFDWDVGLMEGPLILILLTAICCSVLGFYIAPGTG